MIVVRAVRHDKPCLLLKHSLLYRSKVTYQKYARRAGGSRSDETDSTDARSRDWPLIRSAAMVTTQVGLFTPQ